MKKRAGQGPEKQENDRKKALVIHNTEESECERMMIIPKEKRTLNSQWQQTTPFLMCLFMKT